MKKCINMLLVALIISPLPLLAQDEAEMPTATQSKTMAVGISLNNLFFGAFAANFEMLLSGRHGVMLEGSYLPVSSGSTSSDIYSSSLHYRFHFTEGLDTWFIDGYGKFGTGSGTGTSGIHPFTIEMNATAIGANIGKRFMFGPGFTITARFGYGLVWSNLTGKLTDTSGLSQTEIDTGNADIDLAIDEVLKPIVKFTFQFDTGLAIGYAF